MQDHNNLYYQHDNVDQCHGLTLTRTTFTGIINVWDCLSVQCIVQNVLTSLIHQSPTHWPLHVTCMVGYDPACTTTDPDLCISVFMH